MQAADQVWDVIIVGSGMGGATLGYALARAGLTVLFCERGRSHVGNNAKSSLVGSYAETFAANAWRDAKQLHDLLERGGRYCGEIGDRSNVRSKSFVPFLGSGTGGSSALYGMALERFFPSDFTPRRYHQGVNDATVPESWPISYEELEPYYHQAETLYRVRGEADPIRGEPADHLRSPNPMPTSQQALFEFLVGRGLHPYRLHMACEYVPGCQICQSYLCARHCKNDGSRICLEPALVEHGAALLDECEVVSLTATRARVTGVNCVRKGRGFSIEGRIVVLAAGALHTPAILLRSVSAEWPRGLGNESGFVGRCLMRHYVDLYVMTSRHPEGNCDKTLAFNDFYHIDGKKLGSVQSFGQLPPAALLAETLRSDIRNGPVPWLATPFSLAKPIVTAFLRRLSERGVVLASLMEDLPHVENRVFLADGKLAIEYRIGRYDRERISTMRALLRDVLGPRKPMVIKQAENNERLAHACGTCRMGVGAGDSVVDPDCRVHAMDNLYIVDASFFPSSGGNNPALTIAANALRVADRISS
ncbi:MAG: GMC family oxidoreductase [Candidatus Accumulibacter sp.]|nr:GMC family oxidoreductase [Accumulibacter sp.]